MYQMEKTTIQVWLEQGREKLVAREESRPNYEGPHLKFGFNSEIDKKPLKSFNQRNIGIYFMFQKDDFSWLCGE